MLLLGREGQGTAVDISTLMLVFTAAADKLRASVLGWAGGSPVADDNPCPSTWLHPIVAYKTHRDTHVTLFWTIPDCFFCSKGEIDPAVGVPCTSDPCPSSSATDIQSEVSDKPSGVTCPTLPSFLSGVLVLPLQSVWVEQSRKFSAAAAWEDIICWPVDKLLICSSLF